jgi:hypothetical protein
MVNCAPVGARMNKFFSKGLFHKILLLALFIWDRPITNTYVSFLPFVFLESLQFGAVDCCWWLLVRLLR